MSYKLNFRHTIVVQVRRWKPKRNKRKRGWTGGGGRKGRGGGEEGDTGGMTFPLAKSLEVLTFDEDCPNAAAIPPGLATYSGQLDKVGKKWKEGE